MQSAEESVSDMSYLQRTVPSLEPFAHEDEELHMDVVPRLIDIGDHGIDGTLIVIQQDRLVSSHHRQRAQILIQHHSGVQPLRMPRT